MPAPPDLAAANASQVAFGDIHCSTLAPAIGETGAQSPCLATGEQHAQTSRGHPFRLWRLRRRGDPRERDHPAAPRPARRPGAVLRPNIAQIRDRPPHRRRMPESRNVLTEAARIARGDVMDVRELKAEQFDALILPAVSAWPRTSPTSPWKVPAAACSLMCWPLPGPSPGRQADRPDLHRPALAAKIYGEVFPAPGRRRRSCRRRPHRHGRPARRVHGRGHRRDSARKLVSTRPTCWPSPSPRPPPASTSWSTASWSWPSSLIWRLARESLEYLAGKAVMERDRACIYFAVSFSTPTTRARRPSLVGNIVNDESIVTLANIARCCLSCNASKGRKTASRLAAIPIACAERSHCRPVVRPHC